jgi:hypothetical protein
MITIHILTFWSDQDEFSKACIEFVVSTVGPSDKVIILKEDEDDPDSDFSVLMNYSGYTLDSFEYYDELMDYASENELYVIVFDHDTKYRKGYWYDEEQEWIEQFMGHEFNYYS